MLRPRLRPKGERAAVASLDPLVEAARAGDETALNQLFIRYRQDVTRMVYRVLGPSPDLEDVVQEAFVQVYKSIAGFKGEARFTTWLYRVATNVARMHLRAKRSRPQLARHQVEDRRTADPLTRPDAEAERNARVAALYRHLDTLSDKKRTVLVLHDLAGVAPREIAEIVNAPVLTVRTRLFYARKELYAAIGRDPQLAEMLDKESLP